MATTMPQVQQQAPVMDDASKHSSQNSSIAPSTAPTPSGSNQTGSIKGKKGAKSAKKMPDPNETGKLLAAKINQLELNAADEKDQEQEIEREVRKATRDLNSLLAGMGSPMEKIEALQKRNQELLSDMKKLERECTKNKKRADQTQKERDTARSELMRQTGLKDKMEKVARDFTKDNKKLRDDFERLQATEKRSRESMSERHESLMVDIDRIVSKKLGDEADFVNRSVEEQFRQKFRTFFDQYNLREMHFLSILRTKDAEIQHLVTRVEHQKKIAETELQRSRQLNSQVATFSQTETELRSQLNIYVEKFKQVEETLNNSNDLFLTFRKEMEDMSKKTKRLEKENMNLTRKQELTNRNILEMAEERTKMEKDQENLRKKNNTLESLVRRMQDQGRGAGLSHVDIDDDDTQSEYGSGEEDEYDIASDEAEYDDDTEEDLAMQNGLPPGHHGPIPPPPPSQQPESQSSSTNMNGHVNGSASHKVIEI